MKIYAVGEYQENGTGKLLSLCKTYSEAVEEEKAWKMNHKTKSENIRLWEIADIPWLVY